MEANTLLFLDFDGVICDSIAETMLCSWIAYHIHLSHRNPDLIEIKDKEEFCLLRPFIRNSEDYIIVQHIIDKGMKIVSQDEFDILCSSFSEADMAFYKKIFNTTRNDLIQNHRETWLHLNPLYSHMETFLSANLNNPRLYILSTKLPEFITAILSGKGLKFRPENIIYASTETKLSLVRKWMEKAGSKRSVFLDDQISHLSGNTDSCIETFLASWGYIQKEWLSNTDGIGIMTPGMFIDRFGGK